jgi:hypothetical protein
MHAEYATQDKGIKLGLTERRAQPHYHVSTTFLIPMLPKDVFRTYAVRHLSPRVYLR